MAGFVPAIFIFGCIYTAKPRRKSALPLRESESEPTTHLPPYGLSIPSGPLDRRDVARDGFVQHGLRVRRDHAIEVVPVDMCEGEGLHGAADCLDLAARQRNQIRIAAHEGEAFAVGRDSEVDA